MRRLNLRATAEVGTSIGLRRAGLAVGRGKFVRQIEGIP